MEDIIKEALITLREGGAGVILVAVLIGGGGLFGGLVVLAKLVGQLRHLGPLVSAWTGKGLPPAPPAPAKPAASSLQIDDEAAIEFGTALCSACEVAALAIDYDHRIRLYNDGAESLTGWPAEAVMGQDLAVMIPPEDARHHAGFVRAYLDRYRAGGPRLVGDIRLIRILRRDGTPIAVRARLIHINRGSQVIFAWLSPAHTEE